jgi:hypothetical protein
MAKAAPKKTLVRQLLRRTPEEVIAIGRTPEDLKAVRQHIQTLSDEELIDSLSEGTERMECPRPLSSEDVCTIFASLTDDPDPALLDERCDRLTEGAWAAGYERLSDFIRVVMTAHAAARRRKMN